MATAGTLDPPNEIVNGDFEAASWDPWTNLSRGLLGQGVSQLPVNPAGGEKCAAAILCWSGNHARWPSFACSDAGAKRLRTCCHPRIPQGLRSRSPEALVP